MLDGEDPFMTVDEAAEFYATAYRKFISLRGYIDPSPVELVDPSDFKLSRPRRSISEDCDAFTAELFAQAIGNRLNSLCSMLVGLKSWQSILRDYVPKHRYYLEVEFVSPILQLAIAEVSGIKNQIAFSVAKIAIHLESTKTRHPIPPDDKISCATWELWTQGWRCVEHFREALRAVNSRDFRSATRDFRNRRMHAIAPSFFGIIPAHVVRRAGDYVETKFHFEEKLDIVTLSSSLSEQHVAIVALVKAMHELLRAGFDGQPAYVNAE